MATITPVEASSSGSEMNSGVAAWLRTATREHHGRSEMVLDLDTLTRSMSGYQRLLHLFVQFHQAMRQSLSSVLALAPPQHRDRLDVRRRRYLADIAALDGSLTGTPQPAPIAGLTDVAAQFGAWYVLEGSALGGVVIARQVQHRLPTLAGAVTFLRGDGPQTAAQWRSFQAFLDERVDLLELPFEDVGHGARLAFEYFIALAVALGEQMT